MTRVEVARGERVPASIFAQFRALALTILAGYFTLEPFVTGDGAMRVVFGLAIGLKLILLNVYMRLLETRPAWRTTRSHAVWKWIVYGTGGLAFILWVLTYLVF